MKRADRLHWRRVLRALRQECPPVLPVRVRMLPGPSECFGWADFSRDRTAFNVTVFRSVREPESRPRVVTRGELRETLIHEWAHLLAYHGLLKESLESHDAAWGVAYARCYQAAVED
jgi:hypothetical protein